MKPPWLKKAVSDNRRGIRLYRRMIAERAPGGPMHFDKGSIPVLQNMVETFQQTTRLMIRNYLDSK